MTCYTWWEVNILPSSLALMVWEKQCFEVQKNSVSQFRHGICQKVFIGKVLKTKFYPKVCKSK